MFAREEQAEKMAKRSSFDGDRVDETLKVACACVTYHFRNSLFLVLVNLKHL